MTVVPEPEDGALSLVCDACGRAVTDIDAPLSLWAIVWTVVRRSGWTGSPSSVGPHRCPDCAAAPYRPPGDPADGTGADGLGGDGSRPNSPARPDTHSDR